MAKVRLQIQSCGSIRRLHVLLDADQPSEEVIECLDRCRRLEIIESGNCLLPDRQCDGVLRDGLVVWGRASDEYLSPAYANSNRVPGHELRDDAAWHTEVVLVAEAVVNDLEDRGLPGPGHAGDDVQP